MKRILAVAVAVVALGVSGASAQVLGAACLYNGGPTICDWGGGVVADQCWPLTTDAEGTYESCESRATACGSGNIYAGDKNSWQGTGQSCAALGNTPIAGVPTLTEAGNAPEFCDWNAQGGSGCHAVTAADRGDCHYLYDNNTCSGTCIDGTMCGQIILGCCLWDKESTCYPVADATEATDCAGGGNVWWAGSSGCSNTTSDGCPTTIPTYDGRTVEETACKSNSGQQYFCQWTTGCYKIDAASGEPAGLTCAEYVAACATNGTLYTGVNEAALNEGNNWGEGVDCAANGGMTSIRHVASSRASTVAGLRASYSRGTVNVNWVASSQIKSGKVSLINARGRTVASSRIRNVNSSSVSASLGAGKVPAGKYFVRVVARDVSGKRIVLQSDVSIVK